MSSRDDNLTDFERRTRAVLEASLTRVDARVRSRLNQARQGALREAQRRRLAGWWNPFSLMPTVGAVATALLVVFMLWYHPSTAELPAPNDAVRSNVEDLDLLADGEGFDLIQNDGSFYEWAMNQADGSETAGTGI